MRARGKEETGGRVRGDAGAKEKERQLEGGRRQR